jgi:hypothetical protein
VVLWCPAFAMNIDTFSAANEEQRRGLHQVGSVNHGTATSKLSFCENSCIVRLSMGISTRDILSPQPSGYLISPL